MAKIIESNVVMTISKLVKDDESDQSINLPDGFMETMTELAVQLLDETGAIVEFTK